LNAVEKSGERKQPASLQFDVAANAITTGEIYLPDDDCRVLERWETPMFLRDETFTMLITWACLGELGRKWQSPGWLSGFEISDYCGYFRWFMGATLEKTGLRLEFAVTYWESEEDTAEWLINHPSMRHLHENLPNVGLTHYLFIPSQQLDKLFDKNRDLGNLYSEAF
jgi:hypothetical protein